MTNRLPLRNLELRLILAVIALVTVGLYLVTGAKLAVRPAGADSVNINTADSRTLAHVLAIPISTAKLLVADRQRWRGHQFGSVYDLRHSKSLGDSDISISNDRLIARTPLDVHKSVWVGTAAFAFAFLLIYLVLRKSAPEGDPVILPIVALLSGLGLIAVFTVQDPLRDTYVFPGQATGVCVFGALTMLVPLSRPFARLILRRYLYAYAVAAIVLVALLIAFGSGPGHVHLRLFGFEPVEVVKLLMVLFVVSYLADRRGLIGDTLGSRPRRQDIMPLIGIYLFALLLFKVMNDLGPAVLLFGAFITLLYLSTGRKIYPIAGFILLIAAGFVGYKTHMGFFATRVTMWLAPWDNTNPRGGQLAQGLWGMATGGVFGSGLGLGQPGLTPRAGSDLVFATIGEELGIAGSAGVPLLYCILISRGFRIAQRSTTEFDRLLATGLTLLISIQTMMIVGGVTGLIPLTGMTLPFVSFGSSSLVVDFFAMGLLISLSQKCGRTSPTTDPASPQWTTGLRAITAGTVAFFGIGIVLLRLVPVQIIQADSTAVRPLIIPDRDRVMRPHTNPRLTTFASAIPRGRIFDRNGTVLAKDTGDDSDNGVPYLTVDGRQRDYTGGPSTALLLWDVEKPNSADNPLGMNESLRGWHTSSNLLSAYRSRYLPGYKAPAGADVHLTIDLKVQRAAYDELWRRARQVRDPETGKSVDQGAAVVLDASTGDVLAAVSVPGFDPATLTDDTWSELQTDADGPLFNRWGNGVYPPGSTFKIVTATAALQNGLGATVVDCQHVNHNFRWNYAGQHYSHARVTDDTGMPAHGDIGIPDAIRVSCNVYFATAAVLMGPDALYDTAVNHFNLRHIPKPADFVEDLPDCGYGQSRILATPMEMAGVAQAVANNGWLMPPRFFKETKIPPGAGVGGKTAMSAADAAILQRAMLSVTQSGTGVGLFDGLGYSVAGKTGSAQNSPNQKTHSWFIGYAPADHPAIAFACVVERGEFGRAAAGPVCREICRAAL